MDISIYLPIISLSIAISALSISLFNYLRKSGISIVSSFSIMSSGDSPDDFIANITLQNLKDKAISIFGIYLDIGPQIFVEIKNYKEDPLIIKPYESFYLKYGPVLYYSHNFIKIDLNDLLQNKKIKKRIVLSTIQGRYNTKYRKPFWTPTQQYFSNAYTKLIQPIIIDIKGDHIGPGNDYALLLQKQDNNEVMSLNKDDYKYEVFRKFNLSKECLENKINLQDYLNSQIEKGRLNVDKVTVYDINEIKEFYSRFSKQERYKIGKMSYFRYYVLGYINLKKYQSTIRKKNRQHKIEKK